MTKILSAAFVVCVSVGWSCPLSAQDVAAAGRAFQTAQRAELSEDDARAAEFYELADSIVPSPEALRSALRTRRAAGQNAIAAGHAEALLERYPDDDTSRNLARATLSEVRDELARVQVQCGAIACRIVVDGETVTVQRAQNHIFYLVPGLREVAAEFPNGTTEPQELEVVARADASIEFESPPAPAEAVQALPSGGPRELGARAEEDQGGISPWFFVVGVVATVGLGAGTLISGLQAVSAGDDFDNNGRTQALFDEADRLETQTNILIGITGAAAATTLLFAILTDWDGEQESLERGDVALRSGPGDMGLRLEGAF